MSLDIDVYGHVKEELHQPGRYLKYTPSASSLVALLDAKNIPKHQQSTMSLSTQYASMETLAENKLANMEYLIPQTYHVTDNQQIFDDMKQCFGFQEDSVRNIREQIRTLIDSRSSRMSLNESIMTLHADYIGGPNANFKKWWFSVQLDPSESMSEEDEKERHWVAQMNQLTNDQRIRDIALWLLIWGEASVIRFCPELLCFVFKTASDHFNHAQTLPFIPAAPAHDFLECIVTPLYNYIRLQNVSQEKDHASVVGYDDINQHFWSTTCILQLQSNGAALHSLPIQDRYVALRHIDWYKAFSKRFKEKRTWMHIIVNFTRIWSLHVATFWYYIIPNASSLYATLSTTYSRDSAVSPNSQVELSVILSMTALGSATAILITMAGVLVEQMFLPLRLKSVGHICRRIALLISILAVNAGPSVYCLHVDQSSIISKVIAVAQLIVSVLTTIFLVWTPNAVLFASSKNKASNVFTSHFAKLGKNDRFISAGLWLCVFGSKFIESYFFLALSFKDALNYVGALELNCYEISNGPSLSSKIAFHTCQIMPITTVILMILTEMVLFFLDTYLWYVVWSTIFSVIRSFYLGISIMTPWKNIFTRFQKRIYTKLLASSDLDITYHPKVLCSQIWNAIVISMYREHILSSDNVSKLMYYQVDTVKNGKTSLKTPAFFVAQEDSSLSSGFYHPESEAERRIQFLAQSLTSPMPKAIPVPNMPCFTVLTPHYNEKILLTLKEIITQDDRHSHMTLLEYLQSLHPVEWENFVNDTKIMAEQTSQLDQTSLDSRYGAFDSMECQRHDICQADDLPFFYLGFKSATPEYTLRTRIWASLRSQTLYRTITGFMNYHRAIKLLYRVETPELTKFAQDETELQATLKNMASRKFKFLVAMQRYATLSRDDLDSLELIFGMYPDLQIAYIDQEEDETTGHTSFYSCLIDGHCPLQNKRRVPKYRIQLPGDPILGDGKSDNQNTSVIFHRGEYLQLIDANQDNYLEECLKIRSVLGEFEDLDTASDAYQNPYSASSSNGPVAIVGAREYIFSEKAGVLGDVAAGKEQTFGTMTQRIMATIGGKLHYGHPDFLNAIFMTTRGGVSKGQKGLHLNEDIYAGMNAFQRGGRIKYVDYYQCAKGRDLGFGSILNFVTKIGSGMGEQTLSREYYHLGTHLPLDRFLTFFYAHPGFHINNIFIMLAVRLFLLVLLLITAIRWSCQDGCASQLPIVYEWIKNVVLSIFVVLVISFLPLFMQELTERGFWRAVNRLFKHLVSLSPLFEIFVTQTYAHAILNNLTFGRAKYISSGRGFSISRQRFAYLYMQFANISFYKAVEFTMILSLASIITWVPHLIYFWTTVVALLLSPYIFNPHQFSLMDTLIDYKCVLQWLFQSCNDVSDTTSWAAFQQMNRMKYTGEKKTKDTVRVSYPRPSRFVLVFTELLLPMINYGGNQKEKESLMDLCLRAGVAVLLPGLTNACVLLAGFAISIVVGPLISLLFRHHVSLFGNIIASLACVFSLFATLVTVFWIYEVEQGQVKGALLLFIVVVGIQRVLCNLLTMILTREFSNGCIGRCWWTGCWLYQDLGWHVLSQPSREYLCKIIELCRFAYDFIIIHLMYLVLILLALVRSADRYHTRMLFWTTPTNQQSNRVYTIRQRKERMRTAIIFGLLYVIVLSSLLFVLVAPNFLGSSFKISSLKMISGIHLNQK
ncbi:hypothetical protein DM01DRAFT_1365559 [Hesseltinella vesiculosa]|uniref:1,3-beta-glucan synthase n=1 Tax=Hesseltinella vesiculosa TaxID=101127 RepID=A0A1X2GUS7_9FUNG|nr:hypothetical protein DM01DRAFT_1365559 [Hesseltinella vesiculosa]